MNNKYLKNVLLEKDFTEKNHDAIYKALSLGWLHRLMIDIYGEKNEDPQINEFIAGVNKKYRAEIFKIIDVLGDLMSRQPKGAEKQIAEMFYRVVDSIGKEVAAVFSRLDNFSGNIMFGME